MMGETAAETISKYTTKAKKFHDGGEFLPLSVWAARGFDTEAIETNSAAADISMHPVMAQVFRVAIISTGIAVETGWHGQSKYGLKRSNRERSDSASSRSKERRAKKKEKSCS